MKLLISVLILGTLPFFTVKSPTGEERAEVAGPTNVTDSRQENYCNARFNFCIEYPTEVLIHKEEGDNDDGIELYSADGNLQVAVYGSYNVFDWNAEEIYNFNMDSYEKEYLDIKKGEVDYEPYKYTASFTTQGYLHSQEVWIFEDYYLTFNISVPENKEKWMKKLRESVRLSTNS